MLFKDRKDGIIQPQPIIKMALITRNNQQSVSMTTERRSQYPAIFGLMFKLTDRNLYANPFTEDADGNTADAYADADPTNETIADHTVNYDVKICKTRNAPNGRQKERLAKASELSSAIRKSIKINEKNEKTFIGLLRSQEATLAAIASAENLPSTTTTTTATALNSVIKPSRKQVYRQTQRMKSRRAHKSCPETNLWQ